MGLVQSRYQMRRPAAGFRHILLSASELLATSVTALTESALPIQMSTVKL